MRHTRIIVTHYGGPDALQAVEEECPEPKDCEVRVKGLAAGVSLPDLLMREGVHSETPRLPFTPGWDLIGMVDRLGAGISGIVRRGGKFRGGGPSIRRGFEGNRPRGNFGRRGAGAFWRRWTRRTQTVAAQIQQRGGKDEWVLSAPRIRDAETVGHYLGGLGSG